MPKARSPNRDNAYQLWERSNRAMLLKDIAVELGVSESQVRKWKNQDQWEHSAKVTLPKAKGNVTKHKGGQQGNKNATGHGAPKGNQNAFKHGAYQSIYYDSLTAEELAMIEAMELENEEMLLQEQLKILTVRERRLLTFISEQKEKKGGLNLDSVVKRKMTIEGNFVNSNTAEQSQTETTTKTTSTFDAIMKLEAELTRVQAKKTKVIEALAKVRLDKMKVEGPEITESDGFMEALLDQIDDVWSQGQGDDLSG